MRGRQELPVAEVCGQHQGAAVCVHGRAQVLEALEADALERRVERPRQHARQLHERHPEMLRGTSREARALAQGQRGIRAGEVVEGQPAPPAQRHVGGIAEAATEPEAERQRQPPDRGDERGRG